MVALLRIGIDTVAVITPLYLDTHIFIVKRNNPKHVSKPSLRHGVRQHISENH